MNTLEITLPGVYWPHRAYAGDLAELSRVRADLADDLWGLGHADLLDTARLVTSELFANAAKYARPGGRVDRVMSLSEGRLLRIGVFDAGDGPTHPRIPTERTGAAWDWAEGQRGLLMVSRLADAWGCHAVPEWPGLRTQVWATFDIWAGAEPTGQE
jgi:anti-sigma regulatory factor (Ser/Thr protein kinase)